MIGLLRERRKRELQADILRVAWHLFNKSGICRRRGGWACPGPA